MNFGHAAQALDLFSRIHGCKKAVSVVELLVDVGAMMEAVLRSMLCRTRWKSRMCIESFRPYR